MTHGPPRDILDRVVYGNERVGCDALLKAASRARPRLYCFGHIHEAYGCNVVTWKDDKEIFGEAAIENREDKENVYPEPVKPLIDFGKETLMVNAAIMNVHYRPMNAPWLVDIELSKSI